MASSPPETAGLPLRDQQLLLALACGATVEGAAQKAGLSKRTAYRRLAAPEFGRRLAALRDDMVVRASAMLTASAAESIKTLLGLLEKSQPAAVRLGAAKAILDLGLKLRDVEEIQRRLQALEERLDKAPQAADGRWADRWADRGSDRGHLARK